MYHTKASSLQQPLTDKGIVLDLDETLVATQEKMATLNKLKILSDPQLLKLRKRTYRIKIEDLEKPGYGTAYDFWGVTRPHVPEFLLFCFSYFKIVAVWSAGQKPYVEAIVDELFKDLPKPHVVFTFDDVLQDERGNIEKPLKKMMNSHPVLKQHMTHANTLVLDDNHGTFVHNPNNGVLIPKYNPKASVASLSDNDNALLQFRDWLLLPEVVSAPDVTKLPKHDVFVDRVLVTSPPLSYQTQTQQITAY